MSTMMPKIPRFYVNEMEYLQTNGHDFGYDFPKQFRTLPVIPQEFDQQFQVGNFSIVNFDFPVDLNNPFIATLGHEGTWYICKNNEGSQISSTGTIINENNQSSNNQNGWSLNCLDSTPASIEINTTSGIFGSMVVGSYWEAPHSVDLNVKMSFDYSGTKKTMTRGGSTLNNTAWVRNPFWGDLPAWELEAEDSHVNLSKTGRRIWDICFSFFTESNLLPSTLNIATEDDNNPLANTIHNDATDFYSQVITKTLGCGNRPFIFSPDSTSTALDNFAICTFDAKRFSLNQTSPNLFSTKMRIVETW